MRKPRRSRWANAVVALLASLSITSTDAMAASDPAGRCAGKRLKVVLRKAAVQAACHAKALRSADPVEAACISDAHEGLQRALARLDDAACAHDPDEQAIGALTDSYIADLLGLLTPPAPTPTPGPSPGPTPTSGGPTDCGAPSSWTCCLVDQVNPPINCFESMAGPSGSASYTAFTQSCQSAQGILVPGHCPPTFCANLPQACCSTGACGTDDVIGTTAYFGQLAPSTEEIFCPNDTFIVGECPGV